MEYKQIQELIKTINKSNISELAIKDGEFEITIKQQATAGTEGSGMQQQIFHHMPPQMHMPQMQQPQQQQQQAPSAPAADTAPASASGSSSGTPVKSPMIGTFYRSAGPDKPVFVNVGDEVKKGDVLCIIEAMKLFNEIESEVSGRIVKVLVDDATPVEYDQPLFIVEPS
jgi:acetyl-CoA carboxylase biotin carboxyl carrier protein